MKLLLYCTKGKPYLYKDRGIEYALSNKKLVDNAFTRFSSINGTIPCECDYEIEDYDTAWHCLEFTEVNGLKDSCLTMKELFDYVKGKQYFKGIYIKNLHIFDMPKKLNDYYKFVGIDKRGINNYKTIEKAPQNMMYAYEYISELGLSGTWNRYFNGCIVISIHPEHLCKILNGEKTVEVRKKVLKCMYKYEWRKER